MFKKLLATAIMVCTIPAMANAWTLNTQAMSAGGTITSINKAGQTSLDGSLSTAEILTSSTASVSFAPLTGYVVSKVVKIVTDAENPGAPVTTSLALTSPVSVTTANMTDDITIQVTYRLDTVSTLNFATAAVVGTGGTVTPGKISYIVDKNGALAQPLVFKFIPALGHSVTAITATGISASDLALFTKPTTLPAKANRVVTVTIPGGFANAFTPDPLTPVVVTGTFDGATVPVVANAGASKTVAAGTAVTLSGAASTGGSMTEWSVIATPTWNLEMFRANPVANPVPLATTTASTSYAVPATLLTTPGTYTFQYRIAPLAPGQRTASVVQVTVLASGSTAAEIIDASVQNCIKCHTDNGIGGGTKNSDGKYITNNVVDAYNASAHKAAGVACYACHVGTNTGGHPGSTANACTPCHGTTPAGAPHPAAATGNCIGCHSTALNESGAANEGVRSITTEFTKWSHHVTGVNLNNAHCAACHLEGKVVGSAIVVDTSKHMNTIVNLRNADNDADMQWDPAAPNHSTMDNFCMTCHDANGATSTMSVQIQAFINTGFAAAGKTASPSNPFGDTISNRYDKMQRPAVVDVDGQFATGNNSHHAVKGPRYSGRTETAGPRQITTNLQRNVNANLPDARSTIYDALTKDGREAFNALYTPLANAGGESAPRTGAAELGDDSTLHCGDCHTVGQWKAGTAKSFLPTLPTSEVAGFVSPAIGAHGSNNEYMLRNSKGTDERHTQDAYVKNATTGNITLQNPNAAFLVCFNCHSYSRYGSVFNATGTTGPHAGEYDAAGRCNGVGNTLPFNGYTTGKATDGTQFVSRFDGPNSAYSTTPAFAPGFPLNFANAPGGVQAATYTGEQNPDFGNIFGIQCNNCHNSGVENGYGGIHGSKINTYTDGMGMQNKMMRFLPGLGNTKYVPGTLGGFTGTTQRTYSSATTKKYTVTGDVSNDTNWEQKASAPAATGFKGAGCYTLSESATAATFEQKGVSVDGGATEPNAFGTWGGCDDHGAAVGAGDHGVVKRINRPVTY